MNKKLFFLLAVSIPTLSGCAPTDYMDKPPSSLPYHEKIFGYNQAALHRNYAEKEKFTRYFQSHLPPEEYILFSYLSSPGVGVNENGSIGSSLTGEARALALESNNFPIFNHNGSSSIYYNKNTATSRIVESGIVAYGPLTMGVVEDNKAVSMAVNLAEEKSNPIACRYLNVEHAGSWLLGGSNWPIHLKLSTVKLKKALTNCADSGFNARYIDSSIKNADYNKIDKIYDGYFYSNNHINDLIQKEREQAENSCTGVTIPEKIPYSLIMNSTSNDRNYYSSKNQAPLAEWKKITYNRWLSGEVSQEITEIKQIGMSIKATPIVAKDVCREIKIIEEHN